MDTLTLREQVIAANALRIAADQYDRDAQDMFKTNQPRLAQQFQQQMLEARDLADKLES